METVRGELFPSVLLHNTINNSYSMNIKIVHIQVVCFKL